jgi:preprotein translocase subunit SecF
MEFFRIRKDIPFMKHALVFNVISLVTFLLAVFFLATKGLHFSVEFTGGTLMEVSYSRSARTSRSSANHWPRTATRTPRCRTSAAPGTY